MNRTLVEAVRWLHWGYRTLTAPFRGLPSALIIGAQKGGTTSLFNYLLRHPDALSPFAKEVHYFDLNYARGVRWYRGHFPLTHRIRGGALTLEASPYYLVHPCVPERAARLLPHAKLIVLLRNPVDRAFSHYQHEVRAGREPLSFGEALEKEPERLAGEEERLHADPAYYSVRHHRYSYAKRGLYLEQIRRWASHFPRGQLLILQSERLFRDPAGATDVVHGFLGLRPHGEGTYEPFHRGAYQGEVSPDVRRRLADYFAPHNRELFRWLGEEFDWT